MEKTNNKFKPGDKVYLKPKNWSGLSCYIRATVQEPSDNVGYLLKAFKEDCRGIWMFNFWDHEMLPRFNKSKKKFEGYPEESGLLQRSKKLNLKECND